MDLNEISDKNEEVENVTHKSFSNLSTVEDTMSLVIPESSHPNEMKTSIPLQELQNESNESTNLGLASSLDVKTDITSM